MIRSFTHGDYEVYKNWICKDCKNICVCLRTSSQMEVLVSTFNHESFVVKALMSVAMQEVNFSVSVVIHDDFSQDLTSERCISILEEFNFDLTLLRSRKSRFKKDSFKYFLELVSTSRSKYIAFLDGDDFWLSRYKLLDQYHALESNDFAVLSHTRFQVIDELRTRKSIQPDLCLDARRLTSKENFSRENYVGTSTVVIRRVPGILDKLVEDFSRFEVGDYPIWCALVFSQEDNQILFTDTVTTAYRVHARNYWANRKFLQKLRDARWTQKRLSTILGVRIGQPTWKFLLFLALRIAACFFRKIPRALAALFRKKNLQIYC